MPEHHAPEHSPPTKPGRPSLGANVELVKHPIDWSKSSDLATLTEQRISLLGDSIAKGAWYFNPGYSVHAPNASADFLRVACHARDEWLRRMRKNLSNHGHRQEIRKAVNEGRRIGLLGRSSDDETATLGRPPDVVRLRDLPNHLRPLARESGHLARQLASSGVMLINGQPVEPRAWNWRADELPNLEPSTLNPQRTPIRPQGATQPQGTDR